MRNLASVRCIPLLFLAGCTGTVNPSAAPDRPDPPAGRADTTAAEPESPDSPAVDATSWSTSASSPLWVQVPPELRSLVSDCPTDGALMTVAASVAQARLRGSEPPEMDAISDALRRAGSPYVWPRAWALFGTELSHSDATARIAHWLASFDDGGQRRCGVAWQTDAAGNDAIAVLAVDSLADLSPLATRARVGQWLSFEATLLVPVSEVKLVLLGPRGVPRLVSAEVHSGTVRVRAPLDQAGTWLVQLLPTTASGPRPALEAAIFVDTAPPAAFSGLPAPGEAAASTAHDVDAASAGAAVLAMLNAARRSEGLFELNRDPALDAPALEHAHAMLAARRVGHDLGHGGPLERLTARGLVATVNGENLAHANSAQHAHRALWASPSHRGNLLDPRFRRVGLGVVRDNDGSLWVCQLFTS